jgi:phospholipid/cholesterol/gamma-HCH transport system substrate-binding protein
MTIATVLVIVGVLVIGRPGFFEAGMRVTVKLDSARGLQSGSQVYYRGVRAGSVTRTELAADSVRVHLKLSELQTVPADSRFVVRSTDLLGGSAVHIIPGTSDQALERGALVEGSVQSGLMQMVQEGIPGTGNLDEVIANLEELSGDAVQEEVLNTLRNLKSSSEELESFLADNRERMSSVVATLEELSRESEEPIPDLLRNLENDSRELGEVITEARSATETLDEMISRVEAGQGSVGRLLTDDSLYRKADAVLTRLNTLIADIQNNPGKYFSVSLF